jgi:hypothetical protein
MRKRWYVFIALALVVFQIAVTQPFAYAANPVEITKVNTVSTGFISDAMSFIQANIAYVAILIALFGIFIAWAMQSDILIKHRPWWTFGLAVLLGLASYESFQFFPTDLASYFVFILPVCLGLLGGFYSSLQSIGTAKIQKALEYIDKWDSADLQKHRQAVISTKIIQKVNDSKANKNRINEETKTEEDVEIEIVRAAIETKDEGTGMVEINSDLDFALRTISNFWEKMYIVLNSDLADRATLQDAFRELYEDKYFKVCRAFLGYLESKKSSPSTVGKMEEHLSKLKAKLMP